MNFYTLKSVNKINYFLLSMFSEEIILVYISKIIVSILIKVYHAQIIKILVVILIQFISTGYFVQIGTKNS